MLQTVTDESALNPLVDLLGLIESFLKHLDICTKVPQAAAMTETLLKTLMELLSIIGLAMKRSKQRQLCECLPTGIFSDLMQRRGI